MPWPTPQDYNEAIQNPRIAFADAELKTGRVEEDKLGLPRPISGAFANVYKMMCGPRTWAVRCFLRDFHDHQQRYDAISKHLSQLNLPYTVGFAFCAQGIRVKGTWYPILKMEWIQGESLVKYVSLNLQAPQRLRGLANDMVLMVKDLQAAGVAHGDLQHGNILVANDRLRLIDYDGMYVPTLTGHVSHEIGHPNYQHPNRKEFDFGPTLDNFAAWVIYLSLMALAAQPQLWGSFQGGDECLLFRRRDLESPSKSPIFRTLEKAADPVVQSSVALFKSLLCLGPLQVPLIDVQPPQRASQGTRPPTSHEWLSDHAAIGQTSPKADWLADYVAPIPLQGAGDSQAASVDSSWILDSWQPPADSIPAAALAFSNSTQLELAVLVTTTAVIAFLVFASVAGAMSPVIASVLIPLFVSAYAGFMWLRYRRDGIFGRAVELSREIAESKTAIRSQQHAVVTVEKQKEAMRAKCAQRAGQIQKEIDLIRAEELRQQSEANARFAPRLSAANQALTLNRQAVPQRRAHLLVLAQDRDRLTAEAKRQSADRLKAIPSKMQQEEQSLRRQIDDAPAEEARLIDDVKRRAEAKLDGTNKSRLRNRKLEEDELKAVRAAFDRESSQIRRRVADLTDLENEEQKAALIRLQHEHVSNSLKRHRIADASIHFIGDKLRNRLIQAGYHTAADISTRVYKVEGIGRMRGSSVMTWRNAVQLEAEKSKPSRLPPDMLSGIGTRFRQSRQVLEAQLNGTASRLNDEEKEIQRRYAVLNANLTTEEKAIRETLPLEVAQIRGQHARSIATLRQRLESFLAGRQARKAEEEQRIQHELGTMLQQIQVDSDSAVSREQEEIRRLNEHEVAMIAEEAAIQQECDATIDKIREQHAKGIEQWQTQLDDYNRRVLAKLKELDQGIAENRQTLAQLSWKREVIRRKYTVTIAGISFRRYVVRLFVTL